MWLSVQRWTIDASLIHDAGSVENIAFAKLILKRPAYLGRDNQPDLWEQPLFSVVRLLPLFFFFHSISFPHSFEFPCRCYCAFFPFAVPRSPACMSLTALSALIETAVVYQRVPLMKRPSRFCWNSCTNVLAAASIRCRPVLEHKRAPSVTDNCILLLVYFTNQGDTDDFAVVLCAVISCRWLEYQFISH